MGGIGYLISGKKYAVAIDFYQRSAYVVQIHYKLCMFMITLTLINSSHQPLRNTILSYCRMGISSRQSLIYNLDSNYCIYSVERVK